MCIYVLKGLSRIINKITKIVILHYFVQIWKQNDMYKKNSFKYFIDLYYEERSIKFLILI